MLTFFRRIRQGLLNSGRFNKYLLYATGEIALVVIGILIALQVNNWNENRKIQQEADQIRMALHSEFEDNRIVLAERISDLEEANNHVREILNLMNAGADEMQTVNLDSILSRSLKYGNYNPANSTLLELISSGKLHLISRDSLKKNLFKWLMLLEDADEDFKNQDQQATTLLIPYLYKNISMQNLNAWNNMGIEGRSALFNGDYLRVFKDLEFENLYQGKLFWNTVMLSHYRELDSLAGEIVRQTN